MTVPWVVLEGLLAWPLTAGHGSLAHPWPAKPGTWVPHQGHGAFGWRVGCLPLSPHTAPETPGASPTHKGPGVLELPSLPPGGLPRLGQPQSGANCLQFTS